MLTTVSHFAFVGATAKSHLQVPSIILKGEGVGIILVTSNPALSNSVRYSASVRSHPGAYNNICKSKNLPIEGVLPSGSTISTTNTLPPLDIALRQLLRIVIHCSSFQSWIMNFIMYASPPSGTLWKKFPATLSHLSATSYVSMISFASSTTD